MEAAGPKQRPRQFSVRKLLKSRGSTKFGLPERTRWDELQVGPRARGALVALGVPFKLPSGRNSPHVSPAEAARRRSPASGCSAPEVRGRIPQLHHVVLGRVGRWVILRANAGGLTSRAAACVNALAGRAERRPYSTLARLCARFQSATGRVLRRRKSVRRTTLSCSIGYLRSRQLRVMNICSISMLQSEKGDD